MFGKSLKERHEWKYKQSGKGKSNQTVSNISLCQQISLLFFSTFPNKGRKVRLILALKELQYRRRNTFSLMWELFEDIRIKLSICGDLEFLMEVG